MLGRGIMDEKNSPAALRIGGSLDSAVRSDKSPLSGIRSIRRTVFESAPGWPRIVWLSRFQDAARGAGRENFLSSSPMINEGRVSSNRRYS
jgi:hypothetical protein